MCYEGIWGSRGIAPLILHLETDGGEWSASCHGHLTPGKQPLVSNEQEAMWVPDLVLTLWTRDKSLAPAGNQTTISLSPKPVA
jgi:hypothetical protein